ncbi:MAG TPA: nicotinate-nucleotide adenylyltransferase [Coriobacteriia bacterium]|nr:nicotinate-nucleotide adenylyltransferase [Coriobacteriia bacterium]
MSAKVRLGIMGGTFDPVHFGHLVTAEEALSQFGLDKVVFMPAGKPALKSGASVTPAEDRYLMTVIATAANPAFEVSRMEIDRPGVTYTIDTLESLRDMHGPTADLYFITGADAVWEIVAWKDAARLSGLATFIAATRPGYDLDAARRAHAEELAHMAIRFIEVPALAISSTDIRRRVAQGRPIRYLIPEAVASYIQKSGLYETVPES